MANEGSTKPTYSELERKIGLCEVTIEDQLKERAAVYAELARVRGLLQLLEFDVVDGCPFCHRHRLDGHSADCRMAAALSGTPANEAESADIGKLDSAACICLADAEYFDKNCPAHGYVARFNAEGSAETAGEKAACAFCRKPLAPPPITITDDDGTWNFCDANCRDAEFDSPVGDRRFKSAKRAEPSNCIVCGREQDYRLHYDGTYADAHEYTVALAESSLGSPPPTSDSSAPTIPETTGLSIGQAEGQAAKETRNG